MPPEPDGDGRSVGEVSMIGVMREWRGRGLGRELLRRSVAHVRSKGAGHVRLSVEAQKELALQLYLRNGFKPLAEWPHWARAVV